MRQNLALPIAALVGVAAVVPVTLAAASTPSPGQGTLAAPVVEERYGVVRYDTAARRWAVLSSAVYQSQGLTGISCSPATGVLTVTFTPLGRIGTFTVDEDDAYAGRIEAGATPTTRSLAITFRKPSTGAAVKCNAAAARIAGSSLQLWVRGTRALPTPPKPPTTKPTTSKPPTTKPTPPTPSTSQSATPKPTTSSPSTPFPSQSSPIPTVTTTSIPTATPPTGAEPSGPATVTPPNG